ncbi:OsmC family protein [Chloroherpeton thalassium ATCC 35110]|uniref:OsmC family protein n=1 Tax=Chloroherpeton thalassium (strain ATCC 35110 / GB-78) TaxID=517418 RepID=B3QXP3_CHLT3|nr:OsmC family protein [Chloroherpeton thalassium]ACF14958.1 OsmC family protein [Chloroherpeton thalassium ATCC 35110]
MKAAIEYNGQMPFIGISERGHVTYYDTSEKHGGTGKHATPMDVLLEAVGACSVFDVVGILTKKRKTITKLNIEIDSVRADEYPKVFTSIHLRYKMQSPDVSQDDLEKAVQLSMDKYCSVSATLKKSGCKVTWETEIEN